MFIRYLYIYTELGEAVNNILDGGIEPHFTFYFSVWTFKVSLFQNEYIYQNVNQGLESEPS